MPLGALPGPMVEELKTAVSYRYRSAEFSMKDKIRQEPPARTTGASSGRDDEDSYQHDFGTRRTFTWAESIQDGNSCRKGGKLVFSVRFCEES